MSLLAYVRRAGVIVAVCALGACGWAWGADDTPGDPLVEAAHHTRPPEQQVIDDLSDATLARIANQRAVLQRAPRPEQQNVSVSVPVPTPVHAALPDAATPAIGAPTQAAPNPEPRRITSETTEPTPSILPSAPAPAVVARAAPQNPGGNFLVQGPPAIAVAVQPGTPPLTSHDKFMLFVNDVRSPASYLAAGFNAGIDQATDAHSAWGEGAEGYGKRLGSNMGDAATATFLQGFFFPAVFHQDPRYWASGKHGAGARMGYAISRVFVARSDSGKTMLNTSTVFGIFATAEVENFYYPDHRNWESTLSRAGIGMGFDAGWNVLKEFWPEVSHKFHLPMWFQRMFWGHQYTYLYDQPVVAPAAPAPTGEAPKK